MNIIIRKELSNDYSIVEALTELAFRDMEFSDHSEHLLVNRLRNSENFIDDLSLVAEIDGEIVGHCLLTKALVDNGETQYETLALAPVSVLPQHQGKGIGSQLINDSLKKAKDLGHSSAIVLGHDKYYPRFGFVPASTYGIKAPFEVPDEAFMAIELTPDSLKNISGIVVYAKDFLG